MRGRREERMDDDYMAKDKERIRKSVDDNGFTKASRHFSKIKGHTVLETL